MNEKFAMIIALEYSPRNIISPFDSEIPRGVRKTSQNLFTATSYCLRLLHGESSGKTFAWASRKICLFSEYIDQTFDWIIPWSVHVYQRRWSHSLKDHKNRIPLHSAASVRASLDVFGFLVAASYSNGIAVEDCKHEILHKDILDLLKPPDRIFSSIQRCSRKSSTSINKTNFS